MSGAVVVDILLLVNTQIFLKYLITPQGFNIYLYGTLVITLVMGECTTNVGNNLGGCNNVTF